MAEPDQQITSFCEHPNGLSVHRLQNTHGCGQKFLHARQPAKVRCRLLPDVDQLLHHGGMMEDACVQIQGLFQMGPLPPQASRTRRIDSALACGNRSLCISDYSFPAGEDILLGPTVLGFVS